LADGAAAKDGYRIPVSDLGELGSEITCREDIREQDRLIVGDFIGQLHHTDVSEGNTSLLGL
jgi:hypothetical protein